MEYDSHLLKNVRLNLEKQNVLTYLNDYHNFGFEMTYFLPPGVAYMTGLSHNPFTWLPLADWGKLLRQKSSAI